MVNTKIPDDIRKELREQLAQICEQNMVEKGPCKNTGIPLYRWKTKEENVMLIGDRKPTNESLAAFFKSLWPLKYEHVTPAIVRADIRGLGYWQGKKKKKLNGQIVEVDVCEDDDEDDVIELIDVEAGADGDVVSMVIELSDRVAAIENDVRRTLIAQEKKVNALEQRIQVLTTKLDSPPLPHIDRPKLAPPTFKGIEKFKRKDQDSKRKD